MAFKKCDNCGNDFPENEIENHRLYCLFSLQQKELENLIPCEFCNSLIHITEYNSHILSCQSFSNLRFGLNFNLSYQNQDNIVTSNTNNLDQNNIENDNIENGDTFNILEQINDYTATLQNHITDLNNLLDEIRGEDTYDNLIDLENNNVSLGINNIEDVIEKKEEEILCPICTTKCEVKGVTKCGHEFCYDCIKEWLKENKKCPICMIELN